MLEFDNLIVSPWMSAKLKELIQEADPGAGMIGLIAGMPIQENKFIPEKHILLMRGRVLVAIILVTATELKIVEPKEPIDFGLNLKPRRIDVP